MFKIFARSYLDYYDIIYHQATKISTYGPTLTSTMKEVDRVHYRGALVVTGGWRSTNRYKIREELGWESLTDCRKMNRLIQL